MSEIRIPISIGMPVYNGEKYLREAIESILAQTYSTFEFLISDNASTDATQDICNEYIRRDRRIRYIRQEKNIGAPMNWNFIFRQSRGLYFKWASANDVVHPDMIRKCKNVLDQRPDVVLCYPKTKLIDESGKVMEEYLDVLNLEEESPKVRFMKLVQVIMLNNAQHGLIRSDALRKTALEGIYLHGDITLMAELVLYGKFVEINEYLFYRRMSQDSAVGYMNMADRHYFNNPSPKNEIIYYYWKPIIGLLSLISRSELNIEDKTSMYCFMMKYINWKRVVLVREIFDNIVNKVRV